MTLPGMNGADSPFLGLFNTAVQQLVNITNNLAVIGRNTGKSAGHVPVVAPSNEGDFMVFCHECSMNAQQFTYPCQMPDVAGLFPPSMLRDISKTGADNPALAGRDAALQIARNGVMDTPSGSTESERLKTIIKLLTGSSN